MINSRIDCVVRFHDIKRPLSYRALGVFSLVGQSYRPLNIILTLQRFAEAEIAATRKRLSPILDLPGAPTLELHNFEDALPKDARTPLLNLGLRAAQGRYIAFLDYDDLLYPEAYKTIVPQLQAMNSAIAFASIRVISARTHIRNSYSYHFRGKKLLLFRPGVDRSVQS